MNELRRHGISLSRLFGVAMTLAFVIALVPSCNLFKPDRVVYEQLLVQDFSTIGKITISPDCRRVAYAGISGVVVDGVAEEQAGIITADSIIFSPDSQRLAYTASLGNRKFVVVDGLEGKPYRDIGERGVHNRYELVTFGPVPLFSPDSQRVAYTAQVGNKWFMVVDGVEGKQYDEIRWPVFSPDSRRMAYTARIGNKWSVVLDGVEGKQYDFARSIIFSPDSQRLAYWAKIGNTQSIVVDGVEGKVYDDIRDTNLTFSPDSKQVAYTARIGNKWSVVLDGVEGKLYDFVPEFSLAFSPDSQRLAYVTSRFVVVHGIEETPDKHGMWDIIFSPDSRHMAYIASRSKLFGGTTQWVVVDGAAGKRYDHVGPPVFSPDSKYVAYAAHKDRKWFVVVDGAEGKPYDRMFNPGYNYWAIGRVRIIFDSSDSFHYLALKGDSIYLVEEAMSPRISTPPIVTTPPMVTTLPTETLVQVLVDASRDGGAWWFPQSSPLNPEQDHQGKALADHLRTLGYRVNEMPPPYTITKDLLEQYDFVIRANEYTQYSIKEIEAYKTYVRNGGKLLLLADCMRPGETDSLAASFGLVFAGTTRGRATTISEFTSHPITKGVSSIPYMVGSGLIKYPPEAQIVGWLSQDAYLDLNDNRSKDPDEPTGPPVLGYMNYGDGKIVFIGDTNTLEKVPQPVTKNIIDWFEQ